MILVYSQFIPINGTSSNWRVTGYQDLIYRINAIISIKNAIGAQNRNETALDAAGAAGDNDGGDDPVLGDEDTGCDDGDDWGDMFVGAWDMIGEFDATGTWIELRLTK